MPADPFDVLREPLTPLAPRPAFVAELRQRLADRLGPSQEAVMSTNSETSHALAVREYTPARLSSLTAYLCCRDAERAIEWYQDVFGARLLGPPIIMDDGHVGHSELRIGDTVFFLADEYPAENVRSPLDLAGNSVSLMVHVPDADTTYQRALDAGARAIRPMGVAHGARVGVIIDPFGHRWFVSTALEADDLPVEDIDGRRFGDIGYLTLRVPDGERARRFYGGLFGWGTEPGHEPGSFHITTVTPPAGISGGAADAGVRLYLRVDDIERTAARVRDLGGQVLSVVDYESGGNAECVDDQGLRFDLFRPKPGY